MKISRYGNEKYLLNQESRAFVMFANWLTVKGVSIYNNVRNVEFVFMIVVMASCIPTRRMRMTTVTFFQREN
jgi:hypothetical protein